MFKSFNNSSPRQERNVLMLIAVVLLLPGGIAAQTGGASVMLKGTVSETVALSVTSTPFHSDVDMTVVSSGSTVRITLSGIHAKSPVIRVPLIVRSNSTFKISAVFESATAELTQLSVIDVRATGPLVSPVAISDLNVPGESISANLDVSRPFLVLSGPRISLGGTLDFPNNALQVTCFIRMKPRPARNWLVHLTFSGSATSIL